jgi:hypothetical protein
VIGPRFMNLKFGPQKLFCYFSLFRPIIVSTKLGNFFQTVVYDLAMGVVASCEVSWNLCQYYSVCAKLNSLEPKFIFSLFHFVQNLNQLFFLSIQLLIFTIILIAIPSKFLPRDLHYQLNILK